VPKCPKDSSDLSAELSCPKCRTVPSQVPKCLVPFLTTTVWVDIKLTIWLIYLKFDLSHFCKKNGYQKNIKRLFWLIEPEKYTPVKSTNMGRWARNIWP